MNYIFDYLYVSISISFFSIMESNNINNIEEKLKNIEEWNKERSEIKPILEAAIEYHNKARREAYWKNYENASEFFKWLIWAGCQHVGAL